MNLLQILLPDRICMILRKALPAWEQGGIRRIGGDRSPRPTILGLGCEAATSPRSGPPAGELPSGQLLTPPASLALAPLPHSGTGHSHTVLVAPGAGQLPFPAAQRPPRNSDPGRGTGSTVESEPDAGRTASASNRLAGTHPAGTRHQAELAFSRDPAGLFQVAQPGAGLSAARGRRESRGRSAIRLVPAEPGALRTCLSSL